MLKLEPREVENFSDEALVTLLEAGGWESILPQNLTDVQLISVADQCRELLEGTGSTKSGGQCKAVVAMAMLLVSNAYGSDPAVECDFTQRSDMEVVRDVLAVLSMASDREIVSRLLRRPNEDESLLLFASVAAIVEKLSAASL